MPPTRIYTLFAPSFFYPQQQLTLLLDGEDLHIGGVYSHYQGFTTALVDPLFSILQVQNLPVSLVRLNRYTALTQGGGLFASSRNVKKIVHALNGLPVRRRNRPGRFNGYTGRPICCQE